MEVASIVPVGKRVKQGDQLIAIDSTPFEDAVRVQQIVVEQAQAALKQVEVAAENTHLLKEAQLAEAALRTELAKVEVAEFQKGTHPLQLKVCQKEVQQAKRLLEEHKKLVAAGKLDSKSLEAGIVDLDVAETKLQVLEKYTGPKTLKDLEAKIATAKSCPTRCPTNLASIPFSWASFSNSSRSGPSPTNNNWQGVLTIRIALKSTLISFSAIILPRKRTVGACFRQIWSRYVLTSTRA